jgi:hypothetical protein
MRDRDVCFCSLFQRGEVVHGDHAVAWNAKPPVLTASTTSGCPRKSAGGAADACGHPELLLATDAVRIEAGADKTPAVNILAYTGGLMVRQRERA